MFWMRKALFYNIQFKRGKKPSNEFYSVPPPPKFPIFPLEKFRKKQGERIPPTHTHSLFTSKTFFFKSTISFFKYWKWHNCIMNTFYVKIPLKIACLGLKSGCSPSLPSSNVSCVMPILQWCVRSSSVKSIRQRISNVPNSRWKVISKIHCATDK